MVGLQIDYHWVELLLEIRKDVETKGKEFSIDDATHIQWHWNKNGKSILTI